MDLYRSWWMTIPNKKHVVLVAQVATGNESRSIQPGVFYQWQACITDSANRSLTFDYVPCAASTDDAICC